LARSNRAARGRDRAGGARPTESTATHGSTPSLLGARLPALGRQRHREFGDRRPDPPALGRSPDRIAQGGQERWKRPRTREVDRQASGCGECGRPGAEEARLTCLPTAAAARRSDPSEASGCHQREGSEAAAFKVKLSGRRRAQIRIRYENWPVFSKLRCGDGAGWRSKLQKSDTVARQGCTKRPGQGPAVPSIFAGDRGRWPV
jgi:hypothetical protein